MKSFKNCHQKKLEGMILAPVIQEKNINTAMDLYEIKVISDINKIIVIII